MCHSEAFVCHSERQRRISSFKHKTLRFAQGDKAFRFAFCFFLTIFFFPQTASAQNAGLFQYQFQPDRTLRYRLDLQHELKLSEDLPVTTKIVFQTSIRMVEADSVGIATLEASAERFSVKTTTGSKDNSPPVITTGQTVRFRVGPSGLVSGAEAISGSPGLPWNLFLSQVFPDLTRCRYLGPAVFNGQPCAKIELDVVTPSSARTEKSNAVQTRDYNQGKGTGLFASGHLLSGETRGSVDLGYNIFSAERSGNPDKVSARGVFSSRLSLLP